jgi:hypothetical protein
VVDSSTKFVTHCKLGRQKSEMVADLLIRCKMMRSMMKAMVGELNRVNAPHLMTLATKFFKKAKSSLKNIRFSTLHAIFDTKIALERQSVSISLAPYISADDWARFDIVDLGLTKKELTFTVTDK